MNLLNLLVKLYGIQHRYSFLPTQFQTPIRRLLRYLSNAILPKILSKPIVVCNDERSNIIVSFTSFPARIDNVWQVVECMKRQSVLPQKIFLWLSKEQFPDMVSVPTSLTSRVDDIFEIRLVDGDIRSHKKYYYVSQEYPHAVILLVDDDIYYPTDLLERMLYYREKNPHSIICNYGYIIPYHDDGIPLAYNSWKGQYKETYDNEIFFGSGGGTMYVPSEMYKDLVNKDLFMSLTPKADDVWLNAMARLAGVKRMLMKNGLPLPIAQENNTTLSSQNVGLGENDTQICAVRTYYNNKVFYRL